MVVSDETQNCFTLLPGLGGIIVGACFMVAAVCLAVPAQLCLGGKLLQVPGGSEQAADDML